MEKESIKSNDRRFNVFWPGWIKATVSMEIKCGCDVLKNVLLSFMYLSLHHYLREDFKNLECDKPFPKLVLSTGPQRCSPF